MTDVNIDAYFERIGFAGSIAPTLETLQQLHALHPAAIPFENLSPLMDVPVRLELRNLEQKLLFEKRGGMCIEHNLLFKALLESLDYGVKAIGARVHWKRPEDEERPVTHMALIVDVGGVNYLCDVGFGGLTLTAPLRLRAETEQATPHETFRLMKDDPTWRLEALIGQEWRTLYAFETTERSFADLEAINISVAKEGYFHDNLIVARAERGRRLALNNNRYSIHPVDGESETRLLANIDSLKDILSGPFGISLPGDERLDPALERALNKGPA
jgi:N-hydroxyarylamine O-acetyltransferase